MFPRMAFAAAGLLFQTACSTVPSVTKPEGFASFEGSPCLGDLSCRKLTEGETALARKIFGNTIKYETVRIFLHPYSVKRFGASATSVDGNIYIHSAHNWRDDYTNAESYLRKHFIHEMTHVWQAQNGDDLVMKTAGLILKHPFNYNANYTYTLDNRPFAQYSHEQQARIVEHYYEALDGLEAIRANKEKSLPSTIILQCKRIADLKKAIEPALFLKPQKECKDSAFTAPAPLVLNGR